MRHAPRTALHRLLLLAAATLAACDGGTDPLRPAAFELVTPDGQTAAVGTALPTAPAVRVTTSDGRAVSGVDVVFTVSNGGGSITGAQQVTGSDGIARAGAWTLGTVAGQHRVTITSPRMRSAQATLMATATPDVPAALGVVSQPSATTASGTPLGLQPAVRLLDRFGNASPQAGVTVTATVTGAVTVEQATATTDATGTATFSGLTLRGTAGSYFLRFEAPGLNPVMAGLSTVLTGGPPHHLVVEVQPPPSAFPGLRLTPAPSVRVVDEDGNSATTGAIALTAALEGAGATLSGGTTAAVSGSVAAFDNLVLSDTGLFRLRFAGAGLGEAVSDTFRIVSRVSLDCGAAGRTGTRLNFDLGRTVRHRADAGVLTCLEFDADSASGHQYLVLFENMPLLGAFGSALFPSANQSDTTFQFSVESQPAAAPAAAPALVRAFPNALAAATPLHQWDFGDGPIYEGRVEAPPGGVPAPRLLRDGTSIELSAAMAAPVVGEIVQVYLQGIERLSVPSGTYDAVVRYVSDELIIAEDTRLPTLTRQGGGTNRALSAAELDSIAAQYAQYARVQGNLLFDSRHNNAVESRGTPHRVLAVHTLMYADNIWGYTWPNMHYFAFDYWVGTNGTTKSYSQNAQRVADNLFMHEIAHMRHYGLLERAGVSPAVRGNRWLVEGFARFSERLPIAMRLLGTTTPSRIGNVLLPTNPAFGNAYFFDDVPTYLQAGAAMFAGYGASSYVFDYFADQVAHAGGDPLAALREFVLYAGDPATLEPVIARWLPLPLSAPELLTRARIALYTDDYGAGLPPATQYLQYQLRASRPPGSQSDNDPRNAWLKLTPGWPEMVGPVTLAPGAARGVVIDGTVAGAQSARILLHATNAANGTISVTRIR